MIAKVVTNQMQIDKHKHETKDRYYEKQKL